MRRRGTLRSGLCAAAVLTAIGSAVVPVAAAPAAPQSLGSVRAERAGGPSFLDPLTSTRWFSPNGDGAKDKVEVAIPLDRRADVSVTVRRVGRGTVVRRAHLGRLREGEHVWAWNGRNDRRRVVPDGDYRVIVQATRGPRGTRRDHGSTRVELRTTYTPVEGAVTRLEVSREVVFPATRDFTDAVSILATQRVETLFASGGGSSTSITAAVEVVDPAGRVVQSWAVGETSPPTNWYREWRARTSGGAPLAAGTYTLVARYVDRYGNTGGRRTVPIQVSGSPLVAQTTWSTKVAAADALTSASTWYRYCEHDCILACSPTPSARTSGALTVRSPEALSRSGRSCESAGAFATSTPFAMGPLDRVTVTSAGTEHPSPGTGSLTLSLLSAWAYSETHSVPGSPRTVLGPVFHGDRTGVNDRVRWLIEGDDLGDTEHDLETFEVQVVRYAPAP